MPFIFLIFAILLALPITAQDAPKADAPVAIELKNPGFEDGREPWSHPIYNDRSTIDGAVAHTGRFGLRITSDNDATNPWLAQRINNLQGGATYSLKAWVRGDTKPATALAAIKIEYYDADGNNTSGYYQRILPSVKGEWTQIEVTAQADPEVTSAVVLLRLFNSGSVWFDDVEFSQTIPAPTLVVTPRRQVIEAGKSRSFEIVAKFAKPDENNQEPVITLLPAEEGKEKISITTTWTILRPGVLQGTVSLEAINPGTYRIEAASQTMTQPAIAWLHVPLTDRKPRNLTENGVILVEGKPFFPIGLYHVGVRDYRDVAEKGFNCVQGLGTLDLSEFSSSLDAAQKANLMVDVPLYAGTKVRDNLQVSLQKVNRHRRHKALLNWKIIDEPDLWPNLADEVPPVYQTLHSADPDHPVLLTIASPIQFEYWANFCDILQVDPYPIPSQPLTMVSDYVRQAKAKLKPWQNLTAVLQAGWKNDPINQPNYPQARMMLYLALVNGAQGIFWYSMNDPGWDLTRTPLWERFQDLNRETSILANPIMLGEEPQGLSVQTSAEGLQWLARKYNKGLWILLANPTDAEIEVKINPGISMYSVTTLEGAAVSSDAMQAMFKLPPESVETLVFTPRN